MLENSVGIVLAGGKSSRFGSPKAVAKRNNKPFYYYSLSVLDQFCSSTIIVTNPSLQHLFQITKKNVTIINDDSNYVGQGPLAGIYSAMSAKSAEWYIVLPTDVPFIEEWVIQHLVNQVDRKTEAVVPFVSGQQQPLIAIYHYSIKDKIVEQLSNGNRSMNSVLKEINAKWVEIEEGKPFININRADDYEAYIK